MFSKMRILMALPVVLAAAACSTQEERQQASMGTDARLAFDVTNQTAVLDVETDSRGRLTGRSQAEVQGFLADYRAKGSGMLEIQTARTPHQTVLAETQIRDLATVYGVPGERIALTGLSPNAPAPTGLRIAYSRVTASVPACADMDWSQNIGITYDNQPYAMFGCAIQQNIAAEAGNPADLVASRAMDPADASRREAAMVKYKTLASPSGERSSGDSGKVNDLPSGTERH